MADRVRLRLSAQLEEVPLVNEIDDFTPPKIRAKTANNEGAFVASEDTVGLEKLDWQLKVRGQLDDISQALGPYLMRSAQVNVTEKGRNTQEGSYTLDYSLYGPITGIEQEAVKMGEKPVCTISGTCKAYKQTDSGRVVHDINVDTGRTIVGGEDLMSTSGINL